MTKLRGFIPTMTMVLFLAFGSTIANAGIVITGRTASTETTTTGTVVSLLTTIATFATTGIVITGRDGIVITGRDGIVITG